MASVSVNVFPTVETLPSGLFVVSTLHGSPEPSAESTVVSPYSGGVGKLGDPAWSLINRRTSPSLSVRRK